MSINRVVLTGNLTRDPDPRTTTSGLFVLGIGIAVNDRHKNSQTGEWEDYPNFINCTMFGARAEAVAKYLSKGDKVAIEGRLRWSQWERDGQKHNSIEVIIENLEFLQRNNSLQQPEESPNSQQAQMPDIMPAPMVDTSIYDSDIPF